jgi:hypothetical protein
MKLVLKHSREESFYPETIKTLDHLRENGWEIVLLQDNRFDIIEGYDFDMVITTSNPQYSFADFHNEALKFAKHGEWLFYLDFDEYLCDNFCERVKKYINRDVHCYNIARINIIIPQEKTGDVCGMYGWRSFNINIPEEGSVKAINFPDYQTRLVSAGTGKWYGNVHERFVCDNAFKHKTLPFDGGYIIHRKSFEKQITDNALWSTYTP